MSLIQDHFHTVCSRIIEAGGLLHILTRTQGFFCELLGTNGYQAGKVFSSGFSNSKSDASLIKAFFSLVGGYCASILSLTQVSQKKRGPWWKGPYSCKVEKLNKIVSFCFLSSIIFLLKSALFINDRDWKFSHQSLGCQNKVPVFSKNNAKLKKFADDVILICEESQWIKKEFIFKAGASVPIK